MQILGSGLLAGALAPIADCHSDTVVIAAGVSDSSCADPEAFERERRLIRDLVGDALATGRRVVYFSSAGAVYGRWQGRADEETAPNPVTAYGHHKLACESVIREAGARHHILRLPNVIGDRGNQHQLLPSLVDQVLGGHVQVQTRASRDLVGVDELPAVVKALLDVDDGTAGLTVNVATGTSIDGEDIVAAICSILGVAPRIERLDAGQRQEFETARLRGLVEIDPFRSEHYAQGVLKRYVPILAARVLEA